MKHVKRLVCKKQKLHWSTRLLIHREQNVIFITNPFDNFRIRRRNAPLFWIAIHWKGDKLNWLINLVYVGRVTRRQRPSRAIQRRGCWVAVLRIIFYIRASYCTKDIFKNALLYAALEKKDSPPSLLNAETSSWHQLVFPKEEGKSTVYEHDLCSSNLYEVGQKQCSVDYENAAPLLFISSGTEGVGKCSRYHPW